MNDLEMVKLCADAVGIPVKPGTDERGSKWVTVAFPHKDYDPLHDDAQAMALVKRFRIYQAWNIRDKVWETEIWDDEKVIGYRSFGSDLNRAIVTCVAQMQSKARP